MFKELSCISEIYGTGTIPLTLRICSLEDSKGMALAHYIISLKCHFVALVENNHILRVAVTVGRPDWIQLCVKRLVLTPYMRSCY